MIVKLRKIQRESFFKGLPNAFYKSHGALVAPVGKYGYETGLTPEEETKFEEELHLTKGTLNKHSSFWENFRVLVEEGQATLDDSVAEDQLKLKMLKVQSIIANSTHELKTKPNAQYVLLNDEIEAVQDNSRHKIKREAYRLFEKQFADSVDDMKKILLLYNKRAKSTSQDAIESAITAEIERDPQKFIHIATSESFKEKVFLQELLQAGIVRKRGDIIFYGEGPWANSPEHFVEQIKLKKNSDQVLLWKEQLKGK